MTSTPTLANECKVTWVNALLMGASTNWCWYLQSCEFNKIRPIWHKAPYIGLGGNLSSFFGCMTAYAFTHHGYGRLMDRYDVRQTEWTEFYGALLAGTAAAIGVIPGESKSVKSYVESDFQDRLQEKPLRARSRVELFRALRAGWGPTLGRDSINYALIFYGGPRFDAAAQRICPQIGATGGAIAAGVSSSVLTVLLTNTLQHTRMNAQSNAWLRAGGYADLATKPETWWSVLQQTYRSGGLRDVAFRGSRWRLVAIGIMQLWERVTSSFFASK